MKATPLRVLVVRVGAMGDVVHALPSVALLRQMLPPGAEIGWAVEPRWATLLRAHAGVPARSPQMPLLDRLHEVQARQWSARPTSRETIANILALRRELRGERYDLAIDLQGSVRSAVIARMSGARLIFGSDRPREAPARVIYSGTAAHERLHVVEQAVEIVRAALDCGEESFHVPAAVLPQDPQAEAWASRVFPDGARPLVLLSPTAGWGAKQWPAERFAELATSLAARGCRIAVNAATVDDAVAVEVLRLAQRRDRSSVAAISPTISELAALLRRTALVIAGDTGPLHLAAALRRPVVALFGPTDPERNGPYATTSRVLRDPSSVTDHRRHAETEAGLRRIGVDAVLSAAEDLLRLPLIP